ncbi:MAG: ribonuclease HII [Bdellovibrionales bacterium]|nr:ribonuclease HII [Bdellovibrionales bacterium]
MLRDLSLTPHDHACTRDDVSWVVGFDEVGVGCLAGPVVAAAFAYPLSETFLSHQPSCRVRDSKTLSEKQRRESVAWLLSLPEAFSTVEEVSATEIDAVNILRASQLGMARCFARLQAKILPLLAPGQKVALLVDGNRLPADFRDLPEPWFAETLVKGDSLSFAIAAASILAKDHRDNFMEALARVHPGYGWESNVGYPTPAHKAAIREQGPTPYHRRSFTW